MTFQFHGDSLAQTFAYLFLFCRFVSSSSGNPQRARFGTGPGRHCPSEGRHVGSLQGASQLAEPRGKDRGGPSSFQAGQPLVALRRPARRLFEEVKGVRVPPPPGFHRERHKPR